MSLSLGKTAHSLSRFRFLHVLIGALALTVVAAADLATREIAMSAFYLVVIAYVAWFAGRGYGVLFSIISAALWYHEFVKRGTRMNANSARILIAEDVDVIAALMNEIPGDAGYAVERVSP